MMVHKNNYPDNMFDRENEDSEPESHLLASINWPTTSKVWIKKVTPLNISELLESMALDGEIKEITKMYALREIMDAVQNGAENAGTDEEELIGKLISFVEGYETACKRNGIKVAWDWHNYSGKYFQDNELRQYYLLIERI